MTVQTDISRSGPYAGAGTTGPFTVGFRFLSNSHLQVIKTSTTGVDTTLVLTTDYTVSGAGGASGTVTLVTALAVGEQLTIVRNVPFTQLADYVNNDAFPAESHEDALDLLTMQTQQIKDGLDRSLSLPLTATGVSTELPEPEASTIIGWNAAGDALDNVPLSSLATAISAATWRTDLFNGTGAQTAFTLTENPGSTFAVLCSVGGVVQTPDVNFSMSGTTLTFLTGAPPAGTNNVVVQYGQSLAQVGAADLTNVTGTLAIANGGTGATSAAAARTALGVTPANIGAAASGANTDITSLASPAIAAATATTQAGTDNTTKVATTAFVRSVGPAFSNVNGYSTNVTLTTANYGQFIYVNGTFTLTLPVADASNVGRTITLYAYAAAVVTIATQSSQSIFAQGTNSTTSMLLLGTGDSITLVNYSGAGWMAMSSSSIGVGQSWANITGSTAYGTIYYNTTARTQFLILICTLNSGSSPYLNVNGATVANGSGGVNNQALTYAVPLPPGCSWQWTGGGTSAIQSAYILR